MSAIATGSAELLKSLQGRWKTVYTEIDGQLGPSEESQFLTYKDGTFTVEKNGKVAHEGRFSISTSCGPAEIVYIYTKSFPIYLGGPRAGIVQLQGDTLKCCFAAVGHRPPGEFNTYPGAERVLTTHERVIDGRIGPRIQVSVAGSGVAW